jgi:hypothetical protein
MARRFMKGHIEIESDPQLWSQIESLLRSQLPSAAPRESTTEQSLSALR